MKTDRVNQLLIKGTFLAIVLGLIALSLPRPAHPEDVGQVITRKAFQISGGKCSFIASPSSNTATLFGFWSGRRTPTYPGPEPTYTPRLSDWTTTATQYFSGGSSQTIKRVTLQSWLHVTNFTTFTVYLTLNAAMEKYGGINETSAPVTWAVGPSIWQFRLQPFVSMELTKEADPGFWGNGLVNVAAYVQADKSLALTAITSRTLVIEGY